MSEKPLCLHCGQHEANRAKGLCWSCWRKPGVKEMYPTSKYCPHSVSEQMTMEELDALIAEQSKPENLPAWWNDDANADFEPRDTKPRRARRKKAKRTKQPTR
jgi:hypothetical protein